jgi:hypothetical protein
MDDLTTDDFPPDRLAEMTQTHRRVRRDGVLRSHSTGSCQSSVEGTHRRQRECGRCSVETQRSMDRAEAYMRLYTKLP